MKNSEQFKPQPYLKDMTYDEKSWLIIDCRTDGSGYISFYNPLQDKEKEFKTMNEYAQSYFDNEGCSFDDCTKELNENSAFYKGCSVSEDEDYDEESRKCWKVQIPDAQIIEVMTGVKLENITKEYLKIEQDLNNFESETVDNFNESALERKDPYSYRGLRKSDFF